MSDQDDDAQDGPRTPPWAAPADPAEVGPTATSTPPWVRPTMPGGFTGAGIAGPAAPPPPVPARPVAPRRAPKRSKFPLVAAIVVIVAIAGIAAVLIHGARDEKPASTSSRSPEATVEAFSKAVASGDAETFCELLSDAQRGHLATGLGGDCIESVGSILALAGSLDNADIEVTGSSVKGNKATVAITSDGHAAEVPLVKEGGRWVIDTAPDSLLGTDSTGSTGGSGGAGSTGATGSDGSVGDAATPAACSAELQTVETATEAYFAQNGKYPADAQTLVDAGMLAELPTGAKVGPDGTVTPIGACA